MKDQTHHIKKQQVNLNFETEEKARHWNNRFSEFYKDEVLPRFSTLLDETVPKDRSYVIDRLEIDLGTIQMDEFTFAFLKYVEKELKRALKNESGFTSGRSFHDEKIEITDESLPINKSALKESEQINGAEEHKGFRIRSKKELLVENFIYFLKYGVLPWNTEFKTINELEAEIRKEVGVEGISGQASIREEMQKRSILQRFYYQFSEEFVAETFDQLYSEERAVLISLKNDFEKHIVPLAKDPSSRNKIKQELSKNIWQRVMEAGPADTGKWPRYFIKSTSESISAYLKSPEKESSIFQMIMEKLPPSSGLLMHLKVISNKDSSKEVEEFDSGHDIPDEIQDVEDVTEKEAVEDKHLSYDDESSRDSKRDQGQESSEKKESVQDRVQESSGKTESMDEVDSEEMSVEEHSEETEPDERATEGASAKESTESIKKPITDDEKLKKGEQVDTEPSEMPPEAREKTEFPLDYDIEKERQQDVPEILDEYYLRNAGVILTWPYLTRLFENLGYLQDKDFKEPRFQQRAIHLLGFIGTGREKCEEHELILAKFLTAWPLQMPIIKDLELTDEEKERADEMLQSLISHWSVLKNTSVEGLRESFFSREGKLFKEDKQWRLIVEQESYDMLLDRLPYNISLIKLPWMEEILQVDWA